MKKKEKIEEEPVISEKEAELYSKKLSSIDEEYKASLEAQNVELIEEEVDENGKPKKSLGMYFFLGFMVLIFVAIIILTIIILNMPTATTLNLL